MTSTLNAHDERLTGQGRVLIMVYMVLAAAATFRSFYQIATKFDEAPLAYVLSAVSGVVYIIATIALIKRRGIWRHIATVAIVFELIGVIVVGVLSLAVPSLFAHPSVWSWFGMGYAFVPLVLPVLGLIWLYRDRKHAERVHYRPASAVAIGKFEGVHLGHQRILSRLRMVAAKRSRPESPVRAVVLTFTNNPLSLLAPESCPKPVMSPNQRREQLVQYGAEDVHMVNFDADLAALSPEAFAREYLSRQLGAVHVIVGSDFRFGAKAAGNTETLRELGEELGFSVEIIADVKERDGGDERISTSGVREALLAGDVERAARMLGRPHRVRGIVARGDARGRDLGFPTANLGPAQGADRIEGFVPADGIYAGMAFIDGEEHPAAISVGNNPTFTPEAESRVEAYLLDFDRDIYGQPIEISFTKRIRDMITFESIDALIDEMHRDVEAVRGVHGRSLSDPPSNPVE